MKSILDGDASDLTVVSPPEVEQVKELPPLIHYQTLKDYERLHKPEDLARAVLTMKNECVLIRRPLWWTKDGEQIPGTRYDMSLADVCELHSWKIVAQYGNHFAIVAPKDFYGVSPRSITNIPLCVVKYETAGTDPMDRSTLDSGTIRIIV